MCKKTYSSLLVSNRFKSDISGCTLYDNSDISSIVLQVATHIKFWLSIIMYFSKHRRFHLDASGLSAWKIGCVVFCSV